MNAIIELEEGGRLVCYSLLLPEHVDRRDLLWQLEYSITSLRAHNAGIPVAVFSYGHRADQLAAIGARFDVAILDGGAYERRLASLLPRGWTVLRHYPVLHKFMNFRRIEELGARRALLLDCDTVFAGDVEQLFDRYTEADIYAREEPTCGRSHYGYDPTYLDEQALSALAAAEGVITPPPFNLGAVLFNHSRWSELDALLPRFLSYVWRFLVAMAQSPLTDAELSFGEGCGVEQLRTDFSRLVSGRDLERALPYPSSNRWIVEQVAAWLALGSLGGGSYGDFDRRHVLQDGELTPATAAADWVLCHYFSQNTDRVAALLPSPPRRPA